MTTTDHEGPEALNGAYTGWGVEELEGALTQQRANLQAARRDRDRIKAELKIARAREAGESRSIPENPRWANFAFNFQLPGDDRTWPAVGNQFGGKVSVTAADMYWYFDCWDDLILWMRDTEKVASVSRIWKLTADVQAKTVTVR